MTRVNQQLKRSGLVVASIITLYPFDGHYVLAGKPVVVSIP